MRLYNVFYVCKLYYPAIKGVVSQPIKDQQVNIIENWPECKAALEAVKKIECFERLARTAFDSIGVFERDSEKPSVSRSTADRFIKSINSLRVSMEVLMSLCDSLEMGESDSGIDIKIPTCESLKEYMGYLKDIDFILTQCPFLLHDKEQIKFKNVDVGSQWLVFAVLGSASGYYILNNLAKIIQKVIELRANLNTCKMQEEMLNELQRKGEVMDETIDVFKKMKQMVLNKAIDDLEIDIKPLQDGEERDKVKRTIEMMHGLIERGVEIYSSIETPKEVKVLFPFEKDTVILPDNIIKLIEQNRKD